MEIGQTGSLTALVACVRNAESNKSLIYDRLKSGNRRIVLKCKGCLIFQVIISKRADDWEISAVNAAHGTQGDEGLVIPCMGLRPPSSKDLYEHGSFEALMNSKRLDERNSINSIASNMAECLPTAKRPTIDVVKKAVGLHKKRKQMSQLQAKDHVVNISELDSLLHAIKALNPTLQFEIKTVESVFQRVIVLLPYAAIALEKSYRVIGMDGGHGKDVVVGVEPELLRKLNVISVTTRSPNNRMCLLAFMLCYSENAEDITALVDFCAYHGVIFNHEGLTLFSDRGAALLKVAETSMPKAFKYLCAQHIERNLRSHGYSNIIPIFRKIVHTHSSREFQRNMDELKTTNILAFNYLAEIPYAWNLQAAAAAGMPIYGMSTNNISEQVNAWNRYARFHDPIILVKTVILESFKLMHADGLKAMQCTDVITPAASIVHSKRFQSLITNPRNVEVISGCIMVKKNVEDNYHAARYRVDITGKNCDCGMWTQEQQPCICALAACNELGIKNIFSEQFFGRELLTTTWKQLHAHPSLNTRFPGDNEVVTTVAEASISIQSKCLDCSVTNSQKRLRSTGEDGQARASISISKFKQGNPIYIYLIFLKFTRVVYAIQTTNLVSTALNYSHHLHVIHYRRVRSMP